MEKIVSFILSATLVAALSLLTTKNTFSQSFEPNKTGFSENNKSEHERVRGLTTPRAIGLIQLFFGIVSIILAIGAKKRSSIREATTALIMGLFAFIFSMVHLALTTGAVFGSGSGKAGVILAAILSLIGIILSILYMPKRF